MEEVNANDVLALLIEVVALALLGVWGWQAGAGAATGLLLAIVVVGAAVAVWGLFASLRARFRSPARTLAVKVVVPGGAVLAAFAVIRPAWAAVFAAVAVANTVLMYLGPFARRPSTPGGGRR